MSEQLIQSMASVQLSDSKPGPSGGGGAAAGAGDQIHPLFLPKVKSRIFAYLEVPELLISRLVCKVWKAEVTPLILQQGIVQLDGIRHTGGQLKRLQASMDQFQLNKRYQHYRWVDARGFARPFSTYFSDYGVHVKSLEFPHWPMDSGPCYFRIGFLNSMLRACPNVEEIEFFCPVNDFMLNETKLTVKTTKLKKIVLRTENAVHPQFLQDFINACPELKNFTVLTIVVQKNRHFVEELFQLGETGQMDLGKLDWLDVGANSCVLATSAALQSLRRQKLNLTFFELTVDYRLIDEESLTRMFHHLAVTLRYFILNNYPATLCLDFDLKIPAIMERLEKFEIHTGTNPFFMGPLASSADLPNLRSLILKRTAVPETKGVIIPGVQYDFTQCWNTLDPNWIKKRQLTLKTLQLPCGFTRAQHLLQVATVFPNLRDLRLQSPSLSVVTAVFANCKQLERLSLRLVDFTADIDYAITGIHHKICQRMIERKLFKFADPNQEQKNRGPGLHDMKNLKYFELRQWFDTGFLSEVILWHGLIHLKKATQLDLNGCQRFSAASVNALKAALGPTCFVNIDNRIGQRGPRDYGNFWARDGTTKDKKLKDW